MISGHGNIETAVTAIKLGAYDFIEKPFKADRLILDRRAGAGDLAPQAGSQRSSRARGGSADRMVGSSSAISNLRRVIEKLGPANSRMLISGARRIGQGTGRSADSRKFDARRRPFVVINAPAMSPERMEAELFGVESGADGQRKGRRARRGAWRHALPGRNRRHAARDAGQDPARSGRSELPARRRRLRVSSSTCGSSRRRAGIWPRRSPRGGFAKIFFTGCRWCRFAFPRWPSGGRTFPNSSNIF